LENNVSKPGEAKSLIEEAEKQQEYILRLAVLMAEQKRVFYRSCLNEGFTPQEALELTKGFPT